MISIIMLKREAEAEEDTGGGGERRPDEEGSPMLLPHGNLRGQRNRDFNGASCGNAENAGFLYLVV